MKPLNVVATNFPETIFAQMTKAANQHGAINLSQGFPDFDGPSWIKELAINAIEDGPHQYAPSPGLPRLREAISLNYEDLQGVTQPVDNITVTNGATEAIFCSILALLNPGNEVIVFEPFYDSYAASIRLAGGIPIPVTLKAPDFRWDSDELHSAFTSRTKAIIINNPHNPSGHVFTAGELGEIAALAGQYGCYIIADEVYEHLVYDGHRHTPMASLLGARDKTITISSVGKTFGLTGWKVGWACAAPEITQAIRKVHQFTSFSTCTPIQNGVAMALERLNEYLPELLSTYQAKRDLFVNGLDDLGYKPIRPRGTYFVLCPIDHLTSKSDIDYCFELIRDKKVAAIPPSAFYLKSDEGHRFIRFCFAKRDETLQQALTNLS